MIEYLNTVNKFNKQKDLCTWIKMFSAETWERIKFTRSRSGIKIYETTITQNLIFELQFTLTMLRAHGINWEIDIQESINEKANGNDIELYIQVGNGFVFLPTQAKIIYHPGNGFNNLINGTYKELDHLVQNNSKQQIDLLLDYAKKNKGLPCYLLYNYVYKSKLNTTYCNELANEAYYGCSVVSGTILKNKYCPNLKWKPIPSFLDLHPTHAVPFYVLVCCDWKGKNISDFKKLMGVEDLSYDLNIKSLSDIVSQEGWKNIEVFKESPEISNSISSNGNDEFNPKFRLILSNDSISKNRSSF